MFLRAHLFLFFVDKEIFFQEYIEIELKTFFVIFERLFRDFSDSPRTADCNKV